MLLDFKKTVQEVNKENLFFKYLKQYYKAEATFYYIEKAQDENVTFNRLKKTIGESAENKDILFLSYGNAVDELLPPSADRWSRSDRDYLSNYDLKNNWKFGNSKIIVIIDRLYNIHNKNNYSKDYLMNLYAKHKEDLKRKAATIKYNREMVEREEKKKKQEEATTNFKNTYFKKLDDIIQSTFESEKGTLYKNTTKLITFKKRLADIKRLDFDIIQFLNNNDLLKMCNMVIISYNQHNKDLEYKTTIKRALIDFIVNGYYGLLLKDFEKCNNGVYWYDNTYNYKIIESDLKELEAFKYSL